MSCAPTSTPAARSSAGGLSTGARKPGRNTPTIVYCSPLTTTGRPTVATSAPNRARHSRCEMTAAGNRGSVNPLPISSGSPKISKNAPETVQPSNGSYPASPSSAARAR